MIPINLNDAEIYHLPWKHVVIKNILPESTARSISESKILSEYAETSGVPEYGKIQINALKYDEFEFSSIHEALKSPELVEFLIDKFNEDVVNAYGEEANLRKNEVYPTNDLCLFNKSTTPFDDVWKASTSIKDQTILSHGNAKGWHLDMSNKLISGIIYFREVTDNLKESGDLLLTSSPTDAIKKIPYEFNTGIFWANLPWAWHSVTQREVSPNNLRRTVSYHIGGNKNYNDYKHNTDKNGVPVFGFQKVNIL